jgi:ParB-like chromosome segregation protein Spo0J
MSADNDNADRAFIEATKEQAAQARAVRNERRKAGNKPAQGADQGNGTPPSASTAEPSPGAGNDGNEEADQHKTVPIDNIIVPKDHARKHPGDTDGLAARIKHLGKGRKGRGLLAPLVVQDNGDRTYTLIAGYRRYLAVGVLGWEDVPVRIVAGLEDALSAVEAQMDENECREPLLPSEAVALGKRLKALGGKLPPAVKGKTRDRIGKAVGMGGRTYDKAEGVMAKVDEKRGTAKEKEDEAKKEAEKGEEKKAEKLRDAADELREDAQQLQHTLDYKSVDAAYKEAYPPDRDPAAELVKRRVKALGKATEILDHIADEIKEKHAVLPDVQKALDGLREAFQKLPGGPGEGIRKQAPVTAPAGQSEEDDVEVVPELVDND